MKGDPAPIYAEAFALCEWLLGRLDGDGRVLAKQICEDSLALLEALGLALKGVRVGERLDEADERLYAPSPARQLRAAE